MGAGDRPIQRHPAALDPDRHHQRLAGVPGEHLLPWLPSGQEERNELRDRRLREHRHGGGSELGRHRGDHYFDVIVLLLFVEFFVLFVLVFVIVELIVVQLGIDVFFVVQLIERIKLLELYHLIETYEPTIY